MVFFAVNTETKLFLATKKWKTVVTNTVRVTVLHVCFGIASLSHLTFVFSEL